MNINIPHVKSFNCSWLDNQQKCKKYIYFPINQIKLTTRSNTFIDMNTNHALGKFRRFDCLHESTYSRDRLTSQLPIKIANFSLLLKYHDRISSNEELSGCAQSHLHVTRTTSSFINFAIISQSGWRSFVCV